MTTEKKPVRPQRYQQDWSKKYLTYTDARMAFNTLNGVRKRIRRRADGSFDLVVYKQLVNKESPDGVEAMADQQKG